MLYVGVSLHRRKKREGGRERGVTPPGIPLRLRERVDREARAQAAAEGCTGYSSSTAVQRPVGTRVIQERSCPT